MLKTILTWSITLYKPLPFLSFIVTAHKAHPSRLTTTSSVNQLDNYAVDNIIIRCVDDGPSDDRAGNYSISSHHQVIGRRRCRAATTATTTTITTTTAAAATNKCKQ